MPVEANRATVSELHEIWQVEGKQNSDQNLKSLKRRLNLANSFVKAPKTVFLLFIIIFIFP